MSRALLLLCACLLVLGETRPGFAQDALGEGWIITLGLQTAAAPSFAGTNNSGLALTPSFDIRREGEPATFGAPDDNFSITLFEFAGLSVGPAANLRSSRSDNVLYGLPGYGQTAEIGGFAEFWPLDKAIRVRAELLQGIGAGDGLTGKLGVDWVHGAGNFTFSMGTRLEFADKASMTTMYGVSPVTSLVNPTLSAFSPSGGLTTSGLVGSVSYALPDHWTTTFFGGYYRAVGQAADSPVTRSLDGINQFTLGLGLEREFTFHN